MMASSKGLTAMTQTDCLIEIAKKLKEARNLGERCSDRALLYFIDMTIVHVCDSLTSSPEDQRRRGSSFAPR
jgi:hypothetical protein